MHVQFAFVLISSAILLSKFKLQTPWGRELSVLLTVAFKVSCKSIIKCLHNKKNRKTWVWQGEKQAEECLIASLFLPCLRNWDNSTPSAPRQQSSWSFLAKWGLFSKNLLALKDLDA